MKKHHKSACDSCEHLHTLNLKKLGVYTYEEDFVVYLGEVIEGLV